MLQTLRVLRLKAATALVAAAACSAPLHAFAQAAEPASGACEHCCNGARDTGRAFCPGHPV